MVRIYRFSTNGTTYTDSNHLLTREAKPDGRLLANAYDTYRRVVTQAATVGTNMALVTNAWFFYTNNCTSLTNTFLNGATRVEDCFHNPTLYAYTSNRLTQIVDPLGHVTTRNWFETSESASPGYYVRSLEYTVDARGLTNQFRYDANGNVTNVVLRGNLTGEGGSDESATSLYTYTALPDDSLCG